MEKNPMLIIEDDKEDIELIQSAIAELKIDRPVLFFESGTELMDYLKSSTSPPYLILSDVNLSGQDGFAIRKQVGEDEATKYKSVPFIFWSTGASEKQIQYAYDLPAQGFFFKPSSYKELCETLKTILEYWSKSQHPKKVS